MQTRVLRRLFLSTTMFAAAGTAPAAALVTCAAGNGGDYTLDASTPCLLNAGGQNAGTVTVTTTAHAGGTWGGSFATVIGGDSTTSSTTINTVYIPAATSITSSNGSYFILNGEYKSTSTSANLATITTFTNDGSVSGLQVAIYNDHHGVIGTLTNNGTLTGSIGSLFNAGGRFNTIVNNNMMGAITNGYLLQGTPFDGSIGALSNTANGTLTSFSNGTAGSVVDTFVNAGTITGSVTNGGVITSLTNSGSMKALSNSKQIGTFLNTATGVFSSGITNSAAGTITDFSNAGSLKTLSNAGAITTLTNTGSFTGTVSNSGTITTLVNAQGGATPLSYSGALPVNYSFVVASASSYGQIAFSSPSGSPMTVSVAPGSTLASGTYQDVISGLTVSNLASTSGAFNGTAWSLVYDGANFDLVVASATLSLVPLAATPNQANAAAGIESLGAGSAVYTAFASASAPDAQAAFDQFSGEVHASARSVMVGSSAHLRDAVGQRLQGAFVETQAATPLFYAPPPAGVATAPVTENFTTWGQAYGSWGRLNGDGNAAAVSHKEGGFILGADARVGDFWRLGAFGGYSRTDFDASGRTSSGQSANYSAGLYAGGQIGAVRLTIGSAYTLHEVDTRRTVNTLGVFDRLTATYQARMAQVFGEVSYGVKVGRVQVEPFAGLAALRLTSGGFVERGGDAALIGASESTSANTSTLGVRLASQIVVSGLDVTARSTLGWRHAYDEVGQKTTLSFAGGTPFSVSGAPIARNAALVEAGFDVALGNSARLGLHYQGQYGARGADSGVNARLKIDF